MRARLAALLAVGCFSFGGCITVPPKVTGKLETEATSQSKLAAPVRVEVGFAQKSDEDLRQEFELEIARALATSRVQTSASASQKVAVTIERFRRVSRAERFVAGSMIGRVEFEYRIEFPSGERQTYSGDMGTYIGPQIKTAPVTEDGLKFIAAEVVKEVVARIAK